MRKYLAKADQYDQAADAIRAKIGENEAAQQPIRDKIARLNKMIEAIGKGGAGGSAYDPSTGLTTEAWTQPDGTVRITVKDKAGHVVEERTRDRHDASKIREEIATEQARLDKLEKAKAELQKDLHYNERGAATQRKLAADAQRGLRRCIREKCLVVESVQVEQVYHVTGNNPFDPHDPLATEAGREEKATTPTSKGSSTSSTGSGTGTGSSAPASSAFKPTSGSYSGNNGCGIGSTNLTVSGSSVTANPLNSTNGSQSFSVSGANATSNSTTLYILGAVGHTCQIQNGTANSFLLHCFRTANPSIQCDENFSK